ncbi:MAG: aminotransferase class IV [Spirochaetales bacterium]|nr:aminotransferase class IV [Spirochaetales bacterium]
MNTSRKILYRGELVNPILETHALSPFFNYGQGFFETVLYEKGKLHLFERHLDRMRKTASDFSFRIDFDEIREEKILSYLESENLAGHCSRVKILYAPVADQGRWDTVVTATTYTRPINDFVLSLHDEIRDTSLNRHKSLNYGFNLHWREHYRKKENSDEVLFLNREGNVLEGSYTNVLFVKANELFYTGKQQNYLQGIMQERVLETAERAGLKPVALDRGISPERLKDADEVLVCNSLMLVKRVRKILFRDGVRRWETTTEESYSEILSGLV